MCLRRLTAPTQRRPIRQLRLRVQSPPPPLTARPPTALSVFSPTYRTPAPPLRPPLPSPPRKRFPTRPTSPTSRSPSPRLPTPTRRKQGRPHPLLPLIPASALPLSPQPLRLPPVKPSCFLQKISLATSSRPTSLPGALLLKSPRRSTVCLAASRPTVAVPSIRPGFIPLLRLCLRRLPRLPRLRMRPALSPSSLSPTLITPASRRPPSPSSRRVTSPSAVSLPRLRHRALSSKTSSSPPPTRPLSSVSRSVEPVVTSPWTSLRSRCFSPRVPIPPPSVRAFV